MNDDQLNIGELIEPSKVPFSFDAPGWYVVGGLLALIVILILYVKWRSYVRNKYRRTALQHIVKLESTIPEKHLLVYEVNMLLKRIALRYRNREEVAPLRTSEWIDFLNTSSKSQLFSAETKLILNDIYNGTVDQQKAMSFVDTARKWISVHRFKKISKHKVTASVT